MILYVIPDLFPFVQLMASGECCTSQGCSQVGVQHLGILTPPTATVADVNSAQMTNELVIDTDDVTMGVSTGPATIDRPGSVMRQASLSAPIVDSNTPFSIGLRARGASLVALGAADSLLTNSTSSVGLAGLVSGKTPKAVVSDDEDEEEDEEEDEQQVGRGGNGMDVDGEGEGEGDSGDEEDTDDAAGGVTNEVSLFIFVGFCSIFN